MRHSSPKCVHYRKWVGPSIATTDLSHCKISLVLLRLFVLELQPKLEFVYLDNSMTFCCWSAARSCLESEALTSTATQGSRKHHSDRD